MRCSLIINLVTCYGSLRTFVLWNCRNRRTEAEKAAVQAAHEEAMATMRERERRTYLRNLQRNRRGKRAGGEGADNGSGSDVSLSDDDDLDLDGLSDGDDDSDAKSDASGRDVAAKALAAAEAERKAGIAWRRQQAMLRDQGAMDDLDIASSDEDDDEDSEDDSEDEEPPALVASKSAPANVTADAVVPDIAALSVGDAAVPEVPAATSAPVAAAAPPPAAAGGTPTGRPVATAKKRTLR